MENGSRHPKRGSSEHGRREDGASWCPAPLTLINTCFQGRETALAGLWSSTYSAGGCAAAVSSDVESAWPSIQLSGSPFLGKGTAGPVSSWREVPRPGGPGSASTRRPYLRGNKKTEPVRPHVCRFCSWVNQQPIQSVFKKGKIQKVPKGKV